jgi:hypothetical protein
MAAGCWAGSASRPTLPAGPNRGAWLAAPSAVPPWRRSRLLILTTPSCPPALPSRPVPSPASINRPRAINLCDLPALPTRSYFRPLVASPPCALPTRPIAPPPHIGNSLPQSPPILLWGPLPPRDGLTHVLRSSCCCTVPRLCCARTLCPAILRVPRA